MTKPLVVFADAERALIDYLTAALADLDEAATVAARIPTSWAVGSLPHVLVAGEVPTLTQYPIRQRTTVRLTVWAGSRSNAKRLCGLAQSLCLVHPGDASVWGVEPGIGVVATTDPDNKDAYLATCTVAVNTRPTAV